MLCFTLPDYISNQTYVTSYHKTVQFFAQLDNTVRNIQYFMATVLAIIINTR